MMPPSTPPGAPPATPPGTPPTTPPTPAVGGGSSSSLIIAISFGITFGAISLPASNCRGITFTTLTGGSSRGRGRRRRRRRRRHQETGQLRLRQRVEVDQRDDDQRPRSARSGRRRRPSPSRSYWSCRRSTKVCSNIRSFLSLSTATPSGQRRRGRFYLTAFVGRLFGPHRVRGRGRSRRSGSSVAYRCNYARTARSDWQ